MLTAHIPAGYILSCAVKAPGRLAVSAAFAGSILPDLDLLAFYFLDDRAFHHHHYWVHIPFFWAVVFCLAMPVLWRTSLRGPGLIFFAAILLHLVLDTIAGGVSWFAPMDMSLYALATVPAAYGHWIVSFMLHWTFLLELVVWIAAVRLLVRRRRQ